MVLADWLKEAIGLLGAWLLVLGLFAVVVTLVLDMDWQRFAEAIFKSVERLPGILIAGTRRIGNLIIGGSRKLWSGLAQGLVRSRKESPGSRLHQEGAVESHPIEEHPPETMVASRGSTVVEGDEPVAKVLDSDARYVVDSPVRATQFGVRELVEVELAPTIVSDEGAITATFKMQGEELPAAMANVSQQALVGEGEPTEEKPPAKSAPDALDFSDFSPRRPVGGGQDSATRSPPPPGPKLQRPPALEESPSTNTGTDSVGGIVEESSGRSGEASCQEVSPGETGGSIALEPGCLVSGGEAGEGRVVEPTDPGATYELPSLALLDRHDRDVMSVDKAKLEALARALEGKLRSFGIKGMVKAIRPGPVITIFEYLPDPGIKLSRISGLSDDIAMTMRAMRVRIVAPIPGRGVVGIEIPNKRRQIVWIRDILASEVYRKGDMALPLALGKSVGGRPIVADLAKMPHLLVGGTTGSGKSVGINSMLMSLLFARTPDELRLILVDPKMLEFEFYRDIPHLLHPVVTEVKMASAALRWACQEMDHRYRLLARKGARNIIGYNKKVEKEIALWNENTTDALDSTSPGQMPPPERPRLMPYLVIVIDELADLMMQVAKEVEDSIVRLAQKARAAGIHLIVATQRPSVDVITGLIKANMPSRIAFQVRSKTDGRTILDQNGAETLLGKGDMLYLPPALSALERVHGPFVSDRELSSVTDYLRSQGLPVFEADIEVVDDDASGLGFQEEYDDYYDIAVKLVTDVGKASTSMIQRHLKIGYNRAARIIETMEREGVVGPADGARPREVLAPRTREP